LRGVGVSTTTAPTQAQTSKKEGGGGFRKSLTKLQRLGLSSIRHMLLIPHADRNQRRQAGIPRKKNAVETICVPRGNHVFLARCGSGTQFD